MQQTANYQLNQWDGEDRIMRVDFNSDNTKIDAALHQNATALVQAQSTLEAALETERQARASGDAAATQATASAKQELLGAIAAEQSARSSGDNAVRGEFASADAAIRQEFAAADAAVSAACPLVKLQSIVTSQAATQIDLDMRDPSYRNMAFLIFVPQVLTQAERIFLRVNGQMNIYFLEGAFSAYLAEFFPCNSSTTPSYYTDFRFELYSSMISCISGYSGISPNGRYNLFSTFHSMVNPADVPSSALQTLNIFVEDGATINAGSRFTLYGVKL